MNVFQVVKAMRVQKPGAIQTLVFVAVVAQKRMRTSGECGRVRGQQGRRFWAQDGVSARSRGGEMGRPTLARCPPSGRTKSSVW